MNRKYNFNRDLLRRLYIDQEKGYDDIARILGCGTATVWNAMRRLNIPGRSHKVANSMESKVGKQRGRKLSPEHCRSIGESKRGEINPWYGKRGREMPTWTPGRPLGSERISRGYVLVKTEVEWKKRARVVMEKMLGRKLTAEECVHHRDGNSLNDAEENLQLCANRSEHKRIHDKSRAKQIICPNCGASCFGASDIPGIEYKCILCARAFVVDEKGRAYVPEHPGQTTPHDRPSYGRDRVMSEEARANISAGQRRRHARERAELED